MDVLPKTLGRYQLVSLLGEGGMGKVYRGYDSALERHVAIKILPADVVSDTSRVARFVREARAASALNHPNVVTIFDIGEEPVEGEPPQRYIAMELVDGSTLRDLLDGHLDLRKALKIAIQIAEGLAAAHAAGIVHRDLKPENVMVTPSGVAKILDFGLAKLRLRDTAPSDDSRTMTRGSEPGMIVGTAAYMSPEQAAGHPVDSRSDVFSLGCVLYEIASGKRAFQGSSSVDTMHKILYSEPVPLREIRSDVPPELVRIVRKTLAKDPDERYQSVKDVAIDLRELLREMESTPSGVAAAAATPAAPKGRWIAAIVAAAVIVAAVIAFFVQRSVRERPAPAPQPVRITRVTASGKVIEAAISPDAKFVAYVVADQGLATLLIREMATGQNLTLIPPRHGGYWGLTFTPDSSSICFGMKSNDDPAGSIWQISTLGGQPRKIVERIDAPPTFSPDGKRMSFLRAAFPGPDQSSVMIANADGSSVKALASVRAPDMFVPIFFAGSSWSPDGKTIATSVVRVEGGKSAMKRSARIVGIDTTSGAMTTIANPPWTMAAQVAWLPDQKGLVAIAQQTGSGSAQVWYLPYPSGTPEAITRDVFDYRIVSVTADGKSLLTVAYEVTSDVWIMRDGAQPRRIQASKAEGINLAVVPDGRIVTTSIETGKLDLFVMNEDGSGRTLLTHDPYWNRSPAVTHDGRLIVYLSTGPAGPEVCRIGIDGSDRKVLARTSMANSRIVLSPDDRSVIFEDGPTGTRAEAREGSFGLWRVSIDGGQPERIGNETIGYPALSPDGTKIAGLLRDKGGAFFLATMAATGGAATKVTPWAFSNFSMAQWTRDGRALVTNTVEGDRANLWLIPLDGSPPRKLTSLDEHTLFAFAPLPDGKGWVVSRGELSRDALLITGFRPGS